MDADGVTQKYLDTLLLYFEEEIMGEAYFYGLANRFPDEHQSLKMRHLAEVERYAAEAVRPLLKKYHLQPRSDIELHKVGEENIEKSYLMGWEGFVDYMVARFPKYMPEFHALESMAPQEDWTALKILTAHEVAAIEFANLEKVGNPKSIEPLMKYLGKQ